MLKFKKLKSLIWWDSYGFSIETLINAFVKLNIPIESLVFYPDDNDMKFQDTLKPLKSLKHLTLSYQLPMERIFKLITTQTALETIRFVSSSNDYNGDRNKSKNFLSNIRLIMGLKEQNNLSKLKNISCRTLKASIDKETYLELIKLCMKHCVGVSIEVLDHDQIQVPDYIFERHRNLVEIIKARGKTSNHI